MVTGVEAFQCLRARTGKQAIKLREMFVNCSMQSITLYIAPLNTQLHFAFRHKCSNRSFLQGFGGQNCGGTVQRGRGTHHPGHPWGAALHLHLRGSCQTQGTEQENNIYPGHPAAQSGLLLARDWDLEREGWERGAGRAAVLFCSLFLSEWQRHSHWRGYDWDLEGKRRAINTVPLVQNAIA